MAMPELQDGLFRMLRFLQHELQRSLEHVDLRLEGVDDLEDEDRELTLETCHALLEGIEYSRGYLLEPFAALGTWSLEIASLPAPGGSRSLAALAFRPAKGMARPLGLPARATVLFDGVFAYLVQGDGAALWAEVTGEGTQPASRPRLPVVR